MKNDELEKLEASKDIQRLIHSSREQYEQEKSANAPVAFSSVMENIHKNRAKRVKRGISPWWLSAACLLGCIIGYAFSGEKSSVQPRGALAVTDTLIIVHERVDTVYREIQPKEWIATGSAVKSESPKNYTVSVSKQGTIKQGTRKGHEPEPDFVFPAYLEQRLTMPNPESEYYAVNGMTVAEGNYPIHLLGTVPCK